MDRGLREIPPLHDRAFRKRRSTKKKCGHSGRNDIVKSEGTAPLPAARRRGVKPLDFARDRPPFGIAQDKPHSKKATSKATAKAMGKAKPRLARPRARGDKGRRALRSLHGRELRTNLPVASLQARRRFQRQGKAASSPSTSLGTGRPSGLLPSFFRASRTSRTPKKQRQGSVEPLDFARDRPPFGIAQGKLACGRFACEA
jgi:hypothetical protein